jgi:cell division septal protein FtsQ
MLISNVFLKSNGWEIYGKGNDTFHIKTNAHYMLLKNKEMIYISKTIKLPDKSDAEITIFQGVVVEADFLRLMKQLLIIE